VPAEPTSDAGEPACTVVVVCGPVDEQQAARVLLLARELLHAGATEIVCDPRGRVDLSVVDVLARLRLLTRRGGAGLRLRAPGCEVEELLSFAGLDELVDPWESC
jgi:hypothetical protein